MEDLFLRGRQIAFIVYEYFRVTGTHEAVLDYKDLLRITLHGDNIQDFDTRWDQVLLSTSEAPNDKILERKNNMQMCESNQIKSVLAIHGQEINQSTSVTAELTEVEDHGKEMHKSKDQSPKLLRPETKDLKQEYR